MLTRFTPLCLTTVLALGFAGCNSAPIANDDSISTANRKPVDADVLSNDTDEDGDRLSVIQITQPRNGLASMKNDRTITYTPDPGFAGQDTVEYAVSDGDEEHLRHAVLNINVAPASSEETAGRDPSAPREMVVVVPPAPSADRAPSSTPEASDSSRGEPKGSEPSSGGREPIGDTTLPTSAPRDGAEADGEWKTESVAVFTSAPTMIVRGPFRMKTMTWTSKEPVRFEIGPVDSMAGSPLRERVALRSGKVEYVVPEGKALFAEGTGTLTYSGKKR